MTVLASNEDEMTSGWILLHQHQHRAGRLTVLLPFSFLLFCINLSWISEENTLFGNDLSGFSLGRRNSRRHYAPPPVPVYIISPRKELILWNDMAAGLNNQLQCYDIAATLSIQYNRTLVLDPYGYRANKRHDREALLLDQVFDTARISVPYRILNITKNQALVRLPFNANDKFPSALVADPYPASATVELKCAWGYHLRTTPLDQFPQANALHFPFHPRYRREALAIIEQMMSRVKFKPNRHRKQFRLLAMQIRQGDRQTWPLFDCSTLKDYNLAVTEQPTTALCSRSSKEEDGLSWEVLLSLMSQPCGKEEPFGLCLEDYDAVFVATNAGDDWVRERVGDAFGKKLFLLHNFDGHLNGYGKESVKGLLVEQMILALSDRIIPSMVSSITGRVLRLRLAEGTWTGHDDSLNRTYWDYILNKDIL
jgi:hypothetical protein